MELFNWEDLFCSQVLERCARCLQEILSHLQSMVPHKASQKQWIQVQTHCLPAAGIHCALISARLTLSAPPNTHHLFCANIWMCNDPVPWTLAPWLVLPFEKFWHVVEILLVEMGYWGQGFWIRLHLKQSLFFFHFHFLLPDCYCNVASH